MRIIILALIVRRLAAHIHHPFMDRADRLASWIVNTAGRYWPLPLVVRVEALVLALLFASDGALPITRLSLAVALLIAASGLTPVLLRPTPASALAGSISVLLASIVLTTFDPASLTSVQATLPFTLLPGNLMLRMVNTALIGPLILQFTSVFPQPRPFPGKTIATSFAVSLILLLGTLAASMPLARWSGIALIGWTFLLVAVSLLHLARRKDAPGMAILLVSALLAVLPLFLRSTSIAFGWQALPYNLVLAAQLCLPLGMSYAILRHDLFEIDATLRRSFAYAFVSLVALALFFLIIAVVTAGVVRLTPPIRAVALLLWFMLAAAAFTPLRIRTQRWIDQRFYPERLAFAPALADLSTQLVRVAQREQIVLLLTNELPQRIDASWATLTLHPEPEITQQSDAHRAWTAQLHVGDEVMGRLWIGPRRSGLPYNNEEQGQLRALAQQAALALAYAEAGEALRALNRNLEAQVATQTARVVDHERALAVMEERQRLARDLHDSVTQTLFSINLSARAIRPLITHDPQAAADALVEQEASAQQALAEMRALLVQLRTPIEAETASETVDLVQIIKVHCTAIQHKSLELILDMPTSLTLAKQIADDVMHITREALHNVLRHSDATIIRLCLKNEDEVVKLIVSDNGCGFDTANIASGHFGLRGMRERVALLGGCVQVESALGRGTQVYVAIPRSAALHEASSKRERNYDDFRYSGR